MQKLGQNSAHSSSFPSPWSIVIELDHPIYNPGDAVTGQVLLDLQRALACDRICARLYGSARVFFTELSKTAGPSFGKTRAFEQEIVLVDQNAEIWSIDVDVKSPRNNDRKSLDDILRLANPNAIRTGRTVAPEKSEGGTSTIGLPIGRHQFNFAFKLPLDGLYTSFDARNSVGSVRYNILVQVFNNGFTSARQKLLFPVVCPRPLDASEVVQQAMEPVSEEASDKKDQLHVQLKLEKRGYVPGEPLKGTIRIDNKTFKSVKHMRLRILQRTVCYATRPEFRTYESHFETPGMGLPVPKIRAGQQMCFPICFFVSALVPELCVPGCIESDYMLRLSVHTKRVLHAVELRTPLIIGTHPTPTVRHSEPKKVVPPPSYGPPPMYQESSQSADQQDIGESMFENVPPPSYAMCVAGLSDVGESEGGQPAAEYGPVCYHYNFGTMNEENNKTE